MELMLDKNNKLVDFEGGPIVDFATYLGEKGCVIQPRRLGFKITSADGRRLGFCMPRKDSFYVYLTTISAEAAYLAGIEELEGVEIRSGDGGMALLDALSTPKKTFRALRAIYVARDAATPAPEPKVKKEKKVKKDKAEVEAAPADEPSTEEDTKVRRKKNKKNRQAKEQAE